MQFRVRGSIHSSSLAESQRHFVLGRIATTSFGSRRGLLAVRAVQNKRETRAESFSLREKVARAEREPDRASIKKGPDEGGHTQCFGIRTLTRRFAPPSPGGRGTREKQVSTFANRLEVAWGWAWRRFAIRNLDGSDNLAPLRGSITGQQYFHFTCVGRYNPENGRR